jgi:hypothetical protein
MLHPNPQLVHFSKIELDEVNGILYTVNVCVAETKQYKKKETPLIILKLSGNELEFVLTMFGNTDLRFAHILG